MSCSYAGRLDRCCAVGSVHRAGGGTGPLPNGRPSSACRIRELMQKQDVKAFGSIKYRKGKYAVNVMNIMPHIDLREPPMIDVHLADTVTCAAPWLSTMRISLDTHYCVGIICITMKNRPTVDAKIRTLREGGALNRHPERVKDPLFVENEFFDARDVIQVKYEMVRRVEAERKSVTAATAAFGLSRPVFYQAQSILREEGLPGLMPKKRGPRSGHKLREEIVDYMESARAADRSLKVSTLASQVEERFGVRVHRRTIERALRRREKKRL